MTDDVRVEPLTPRQILGLRGELVIDAARRIRGVQEWRARDNAGPGVVVEAMADVVRLADALDDYDAALDAFRALPPLNRPSADRPTEVRLMTQDGYSAGAEIATSSLE